MTANRSAVLLLGLGFGAASVAGGELRLSPAADNTLYETAADQDDMQFEVSNGVGTSLFTGRTGLDAAFRRRRALLYFDLSELPPDAVLVFAELTLHQTKAAPGSPPAETGLHRVLEAWGEGASNAFGPEGQGNFAEPGDATWHSRFWPDTPWTTPGGDFDVEPSASTTIGRVLTEFRWTCGAGLLADLEHWQTAPQENFGWILVGGELAGFSAHRFASREHPDPSLRPRLVLRYRDGDALFGDGFESRAACDPG